MTTVILQCKTNGYYISLSIENNVYVVQACPCFDDARCGYPVQQMIYGFNDLKNAKATFKRYCKKYA